MNTTIGQYERLKNLLCWMIAAMFITSCSPRALEISGAEKLNLITNKVPNMLARDVRPGEWVEFNVKTTVIPAHSTPTENETMLADRLKDLYPYKRVTVTKVTRDQVFATISGGTTQFDQALAREPVFSIENLTRSIHDANVSMGRKAQKAEIKDAKYWGTESIVSLGRNIVCQKVSVNIYLRSDSVRPEVKYLETTMKMTWWFHDSVPIDGVAKMTTDFSLENRGEYVRILTTYELSGNGKSWDLFLMPTESTRPSQFTNNKENAMGR